MGKISVGLRGWRFDEAAVLDDAGNFRHPNEMPPDERDRLLRLTAIHDDPCDACYLVHGDAEIRRCNVATVVYGEPFSEVLLCDAHEPDFYYWYFEAGGDAHRGTEAFQSSFHEWFAGGNRAPAGYEGVDHEVGDADVPSPDVPETDALAVYLPEPERLRYDLRRVTIERGAAASRPADDAEEDLDTGDLDIDREYPS